MIALSAQQCQYQMFCTEIATYMVSSWLLLRNVIVIMYIDMQTYSYMDSYIHSYA